MNRLLVRNLPSVLTDAEKKEFLELFGASEVTVFPCNGKMRNTCFVSFPDSVSAKQGLNTLHQFELLGARLVVEYARTVDENLANQYETKSILERKLFVSDNVSKKTSSTEEDENEVSEGMNPKLNVHHELPHHLHYKYPDPSILILTNIANALASVPKFYTQVLHLMNKMNLPPPFTGLTPTPPLLGDSTLMQDVCTDTSDLKDFACSDESELESDSDTGMKHEIYKEAETLGEPVQKRKKLRIIRKDNQEKLKSNNFKTKVLDTVENTFDCVSSSKRFEFKLAASIKEVVEKRAQPAVSYNVFDERGEFGKIQPVNKNMNNGETNITEKEEEDDIDDESHEYISLKQLKENRISNKEILLMAQFKNYSPGAKTNRLYVKNLAKQVTVDDLNYIFLRFMKHCDNKEKKELDIRLMQEGRMKGQAFITFPSEEIAEKALNCTHGYILHEKPLVIQYGRTANGK